jgi:hypothetical protein
MTSPLQIAARQMHLGLLWGASLLVPRRRRAEWSQEWRTESWYVLRECFSETSANPRSIREATRFCMGAYQDAIWFRRRSWQEQLLFARTRTSPSLCLLLLIGTFFLTWGIAHISPRVAAGMSRIQVYPWRMSDTGAAPCDCPFELSVGRRSLRNTQQLFDGFSHYKITQEAVWSEDMPATQWTVAQARSDFFDVLHLSVRLTDGGTRAPDRLPRVVLSQDTWLRQFGGKPHIAGAKLHVGSVNAIVAGVAFGGSTVLPGGAKAWLLDSDSQVGNGKSEFVVGHLSSGGYFDDGRWGLSVGGILLAFLVLPFVRRLSIGEYGSGSHKPSLARRGRFWTFLFAKITILLAIVYYTSLDLGCLLVQPFSRSSDYIQAASAVALCLLGLGWAFRDQQRRCPICLRRMAHPVEVGQPSQTFLGWNGTELVCERGHTLLHIPETRTSWFSSQRWVCLDGSWQFLFARPNG